jgi:hypothetical protein
MGTPHSGLPALSRHSGHPTLSGDEQALQALFGLPLTALVHRLDQWATPSEPSSFGGRHVLLAFTEDDRTVSFLVRFRVLRGEYAT